MDDAKDLNSWMADTKAKLRDNQQPTDVADAERLLKEHQELLDDVKASKDRWVCNDNVILTLKVLVMIIEALDSFDRIITAQWEGMGDVVSARYELALLLPCPTIRVLSYSNCLSEIIHKS